MHTVSYWCAHIRNVVPRGRGKPRPYAKLFILHFSSFIIHETPNRRGKPLLPAYHIYPPPRGANSAAPAPLRLVSDARRNAADRTMARKKTCTAHR